MNTLRYLLLLVLLCPPALHAQTFQGLGDLPGGIFDSEASGVSADGSVVVGFSYGENELEAFRWSAAGGMQGLGFHPDGGDWSVAFGVSADGQVVVGIADRITGGNEAFRWTTGGGMQGLGFYPGECCNSGAYDASADGSVVVGYGYSKAQDGNEAFRWTEGSGMTGIGDLPGGSFHSVAYGVSADGSVVVGFGDSAEGSEAFRWTEDGGMEGLGFLPASSFCEAQDVSADGTVIVGDCDNGAFIWTEEEGMRNLQEVLEDDYGLDLTGWTLDAATGVSARGSVIVGWGINPDGAQEAWRAELNASATWLEPVSGFFNEPFRWSINDIPGEQHDVVFNAPTTEAYTVTFIQDETTRSLLVNESTVELDLGSATYSIAGRLSVGSDGNGANLFTSGGALAAGPSEIAEASGEFGSLIVGDTGTPTTLSVDGALVVGLGGTASFGLTGTATIESGLAVGLEEGSTGFVSVHSGLLQVPEGGLGTDIGDAGTGMLTVESEGSLSVIGTLSVGSQPTGNGTLAFVGGASGTTHDELVVGQVGVGGLEVTGGSALSSNVVKLGREEGSLGTALVDGAGSRWDISGSLDVGLDGAALVSVLNEGILCLGDNVVLNVGSQGQFIGDGDIYLGLFSPACPDPLQGRPPSAHVGGVAVASPTLLLSEGAVVEADGVILDEGGTLGGDGTLDLPITNAGAIAPGGFDSTGVFTLANDYTQTAEGLLEIEFGGPSPGSGYDQLAVTGNATLSGMLQLDRIGEYTPEVGETYTLLSAGSLTGTFDTVEEPPDVELDVSYTATEVIATVTAVTVANEPDAPGAPSAFVLHPVYPNPFNPQALVPFSLAEAGRVRLVAYDALGREVAVLVDATLPAGRHEAVLYGRGLTSGVYLVRMTAGTGPVQARTVTLLR